MQTATTIGKVHPGRFRSTRASLSGRCPLAQAVSVSGPASKDTKAPEFAASPLDVLRDAAATLTVPPKLVLRAMTALEDQKLEKFDKDPAIFTNGVFLGALAYMIFAGPYEVKKRKLEFDVTFLTLGVGPFKATIPLKKDGAVVDQIANLNGDKDILKKKMPFFLYVYADEGMVVARGASGGLALWVNADSEWQAKSGVLRVYQ